MVEQIVYNCPIQVQFLAGRPTLEQGVAVMKPTSLHIYIDRTLVWDTSPEEYKFWDDFFKFCSNSTIKDEPIILALLPDLLNSQYQGPSFDDYLPYKQLKIIAKYWHRFGQLPSVELLKELVG